MPQTPPRPDTPWRLPSRVAYIVNHSLPYSSDGYAVRTHQISRALTRHGHDVLVINRPGQPWDIEGFAQDRKVPLRQTIDGVHYIFLPARWDAGAKLRTRLRQAERILLEAFEIFRPAAVLAVSGWENAEPAQYAARRAAIPFFYEQRGFWEMSHAANDPDYARSPEFEQRRSSEAKIAQSATAVFTLTREMHHELVQRGVDRDKVQLVPNGVPDPQPIDRTISRASLGCSAKYLLGYVGSLSPYEGCEDLVALIRILRDKSLDVDMLIVGSDAPKGLVETSHPTPARQRLIDIAKTFDVEAHIHLVSQVPNDRVGSYYALLDAMIMPRRRTPVTERVAPLKPYAAAAYSVPVFMTDMPALQDVAKDIHASLFPEGNIHALADMVTETLLKGGHPAVLTPLPRSVAWTQRVVPVARHLKAATASQPKFPAPSATVTEAKVAPKAADNQDNTRFDTGILPRVALRNITAAANLAAIGPARHLSHLRLNTKPLTRANLLATLATDPPGVFLIDWVGLQDTSGEWDGLWSIDNMRLNRQVMDACRIALDRGWKLQVCGPVLRSRAPMFQTVSGLFEEIVPNPAKARGPQERP